MDSKNLGRRNALQLAKEGQIARAIEAFQEVLADGAVPYDFVHLGDLCIRDDRRAEALVHYEEAIAGYGRLGFNRNAIALWRKILRLDGSRVDAYARMGDLYAAEQLVGDALHAYFVYLERAWEKEHGSASFSDVLRRVEELAPRRAEYAIRLSEFLVRDDQPAQAASVLMRAAEAAQTVGAAELAQELRERARRVDPAAAGPASPEAWDLPEPEPVAAAPLTPVTDAEVEPLRFGEVDLDGAATARGADKVPVDRVVLPSDHPLIDRFLDEGRAEDALALCEQIAAEPGVSSEESAWLAQARGRALALLGRHAEAIREMRFALQDAGTGPEAAAWTRALAGELEKVGELDEARALLREAIESDPGDAAAIERLAALEDRAA